MSYRITGLDPTPFRNLFGLSDEKLGRVSVKGVVADAKPGYPDRVELRGAEPGETLLLLNYLHQTPSSFARGPWRLTKDWTRRPSASASGRSRFAPSTPRA